MIPECGPQTVFLYNSMQSMLCNLCYAIYVLQSMLCNLCYAIYAMQSMLDYRCVPKIGFGGNIIVVYLKWGLCVK